MAALSIELPNVTAEMLLRLSEKARQQGTDSLEEYVCALIMRDTNIGMEDKPVESSANVRLRVLLDCIWQLAQTKDCTPAELDALFAHARKEAQAIGVGSEPSAELEPPLLGEHHPWTKAAGSLTGETWKEFMAELDRKHEESLQEAQG